MRLIDAEILLELLVEEGQNNSAKYGLKLGDLIKYTIPQIVSIIDNMPIIEAEPIRHGKWLTEIFEYELKPEKAHYFKCSVCRKGGVVTDNEGIQKYKFCAFCGAKMDGGIV